MRAWGLLLVFCLLLFGVPFVAVKLALPEETPVEAEIHAASGTPAPPPIDTGETAEPEVRERTIIIQEDSTQEAQPIPASSDRYQYTEQSPSPVAESNSTAAASQPPYPNQPPYPQTAQDVALIYGGAPFQWHQVGRPNGWVYRSGGTDSLGFTVAPGTKVDTDHGTFYEGEYVEATDLTIWWLP